MLGPRGRQGSCPASEGARGVGGRQGGRGRPSPHPPNVGRGSVAREGRVRPAVVGDGGGTSWCP